MSTGNASGSADFRGYSVEPRESIIIFVLVARGGTKSGLPEAPDPWFFFNLLLAGWTATTDAGMSGSLAATSASEPQFSGRFWVYNFVYATTGLVFRGIALVMCLEDQM